MKHFTPPGDPKYAAVTPESVTCIELLGEGAHTNGVVFSRDEAKSIFRLYGYNITSKPESYPEIPADPGPKPNRFDSKYDPRIPENPNIFEVDLKAWSDVQQARKNSQPAEVDGRHRLEMAGAVRNCMRNVERDGARAIGLLAKLVEPGRDPVKFLAEILQEAGFDILTGWEDEPWEE